ncbi:MAG: hypothetical protein KBT07_01240 [Clostridiales bacterium]|nr:hypothetical protein [Candidatus Scatonaster coprocaballi]
MAQGKRPNNGKRPNQANQVNPGKQANRGTQGRRPSGSEQARIKSNPNPSHNPNPNQRRTAPQPIPKDRPLFGDENLVTTKSGEESLKENLARPKEKKSWFRRWAAKRKAKQTQTIAEEKKPKTAEPMATRPEETVPDASEARRQHMAQTRKKESLNAAFHALLSILILTGLMIIAVLYVVDYVAAKPTYAFATEGSIEHTIGATALVVRNESVIPSSITGELLPQATEGSRVSKSQLLAMVIPSGMEGTLQDLNNVEKQIVDRERELIAQGKGSGAETIFDETNEEIDPLITMIRQDAMQRKLNNMNSYASSIRVLMEERDSALKSIDFNDETLDSLRTSESALNNQLEMKASSIKAEEPGIVSFKLDGYEEEITYELILDMVDTKCQELVSSCDSIITGDMEIKQGEPVIRVIQNDVQYFACEIEDVSMMEFQLGSKHTIRIPEEGIAISDCKVIRSSVTRKGMLIVFETNNQVERLLDRRTVNIEIVQTKTSGIKVPVSSLVDADYDRGVATIYVNESGYAKGYTVTIKDYDREYAIIEPVGESKVPDISTIVITNPKTVKEGDKVEK